jgi:MFS family permease
VGYIIRRRLDETPIFSEEAAHGEVPKTPLSILFKHHWRSVLRVMFAAFIAMINTLYTVFALTFATSATYGNGFSSTFMLWIAIVANLIAIAIIPFWAGLSDKVGRKPVYNAGAIFGLVFAFPAAWLIQSGSTLGIVAAFVGGLGLIYGWVYGPLAAFWSELFDTRYRYSALSSLYQISGIVASGFTPLIAAWLVVRGDGTLWLVAMVVRAVWWPEDDVVRRDDGADADQPVVV